MRTTLSSPQGVLGRGWPAGEGTLEPRTTWTCGWTNSIDHLEGTEASVTRSMTGGPAPSLFPTLGFAVKPQRVLLGRTTQCMREFHDLGGVPWLLHLSSCLCLWGGASVPGSRPPLVGKMRWGLSMTYKKTNSWALTPLCLFLPHWL